MTEVPYWIAVLQGLLTPTIALAVGVIAFLQWRTAHNKLVLDLFDRRFKVFMDVREIVSKSGMRNELTNGGLPNEVIAEGRFLFGRDIVGDLEEVHRLCGQIETGNGEASTLLDRKFKEMLPKFETYMKMDHKIR